MIEESDQWVKTNWQLEELRNKTIQFRTRLRDGRLVEGDGLIEATKHPGADELKRIEVVFTSPPSGGTAMRFFIPQEAIEKLVKNPAGSDYEFSLFLK